MAVTNKFKVYGQVPAVSNVFDPDSQEYSNLYRKGIAPNTVAKSQDVLTPLREATIATVAFLNWLASHNFTEGVVPFEDPEVVADASTTETNLDDMVANLQEALKQAIDDPIANKENLIERNNTNKKGFLKYTGSVWDWDQSSYQPQSNVLTEIATYFSTSSNKGFIYKSTGSSTLKNTGNKQFVYFDSETQDSSGNYILNLKTFNYD